MKNSAEPLCAARLSRRSASARVAACHSNTAPHVPARSACSAAHSASAVRGARIVTKRAGSTPQYASASACRWCGGWTSMIGRVARRPSTGASRRSSPIPACWTSSSTRHPAGQPPPGSSAVRSAWPVSMPRAPERASCDARQSEAWISSGLARAASIGFRSLYKCTGFPF